MPGQVAVGPTAVGVAPRPFQGPAGTRSGRVYRLSGFPDHDPDGDYVWSVRATRAGISYRDVMEVFVEEYAWEAARH